MTFYPLNGNIQGLRRDLRVKIVSNKAVSGVYSLNMLDEAYFLLIGDLGVEFDKQMQGVLKKLKII